MKYTGFYVFLTIVLTLYTVINLYIVIRGWQALPTGSWARPVFLILILLLILAYPLGRFLERMLDQSVFELLIKIGSYYLAFMVYAFFLVLFIDVIRVLNALFHFIPPSWRQPNSQVRLMAFCAVGVAVLLITLIGAWNARNLRVRNLSLTISKTAHSPDQLRLVMVSDIHLGTIIHRSRLQRIVKLIDSQHPDLVLLVGDIFDEDVSSIIEQDMASILIDLKSRFGVYAIPGNHEYYSGIDNAVNYLKQSGVTVLRDSTVNVGDCLYLIGRDDRTLNQFGGKRKSLAQLMEGVDPSYPIILMDHQPFNLAEAERNGVDLQLSGHTHHGQLFPFNLITKRVYELSWGYLQKGKTHFYVSCGAGTWGPPVRLGNVPEVVTIDLHLQGNN
jgi:predicted MPP superfamily phosphohydrolase